ncbi:type 1 glutamine amidotransferase domain-containing protein [Brackiella oedipodis]|uniref:type 1 glutamine amidotransferase domain-containing protein n=1 Tax=Brackiella oedipodis TaxID=124225 RepID=UPI00048AB6A9|nr:type 1 glutamine amidotransferase domain-containing protein [Brackiella oedipodis]
MSKNILILTTAFGVERDELTVPAEQLKAKGHKVTIATPDGKSIQTVTADKDWDKVVSADAKIADVEQNFDVVVLPGGTVNADNARINEDIQQFVKSHAQAGKTVAAICHAPWVLIDTGLSKGKNLTSYISIRLDLENAGAQWHDKSVVQCKDNGYLLITSRNPNDLEDFVNAIDAA